MDVTLKAVKSEINEWSLQDRLGRNLGKIREAGNFVITPIPGGALQAVKPLHNSLDEAMTEIARHMNGACELDSQDRG